MPTKEELEQILEFQEKIAEELEVLAILKRHLRIKTYKECDYKILQTEEMAIINDEEYKKIKEWLDE